MGLCWTSAEGIELEPFILGTAQMWGKRTDFALMNKTEDKEEANLTMGGCSKAMPTIKGDKAPQPCWWVLGSLFKIP